METICLLAQFPPPMHGLSKAVETLYNSRLKDKYYFSKIDITNNKRIILSLLALMNCKSDILYFTLSQTKGGNLRDLLFLKVIQWRRKKCVVHIHGGYYRQLVDNNCSLWQRQMNYNAMKRLAGGILLGHSLHSMFEGMLPDWKIFVCPNCVDNQYIAKSIDNKIKGIINGAPLHILYLSNFIQSKGYREILELAKMANQRDDREKFVFHFAGNFFETSEEKYFNATVVGLRNVVYHGVVSGQEKKDLLDQCHIFSLLTWYPNEGQPISILETMGNGMTIITTNHAGIPEIVSAENGYICNKQDIDIEKIYNYLLDCYNERDKLVEVCKRNYEIVKENYTEKKYIDNMDRIFEIICRE